MTDQKLRGLLAEVRAALDTFADVAPAVSLRADIRAALADAPAQPLAAPDGWVLVPIYPTMEMRESGNKALDLIKSDVTRSLADKAYYAYEAMLKAAPQPPAPASQPVAVPAAWAATSEEGNVEALGMNQSRRFDTPLYTTPQPAAPAQPRDDAVFVVWWSDHMPNSTEADAWAEWCALRSNQPATRHPAVKSDMTVNGGALKLALNVLRRAGKTEVADEPEITAQPVTWPTNAAEVREFMASNCGRTEYANAPVTDDVAEYNACAPSDNDRYQLTAHDFLSAVDWWTDRDATAPAAQALHVAATSCPHEIDKDKIVLHFDSKQPGKNALAQLAARLQAAQAQPAVQTQRTGLCCRSPAQALDSVRVFWQQHTQADALSMTMAELHNDVELVIRAARGAAQAAPKFAAKLPSPANLGTAPKCLNLNDQAMWVLGWNECLDAARAAQKGNHD